MTIKNLPWVPHFLSEMLLEDRGDGTWTSADGRRSIVLGETSAVITTEFPAAKVAFPDFSRVQTQHPYPERPTELWLSECIIEHSLKINEGTEELKRLKTVLLSPSRAKA